MPHSGRYTKKLTGTDILYLLAIGKYTAELDTGMVLSKRTGKYLFTFEGNDEGHLFVRLYASPKYRTVPVSHIIWMAGTRSVVPHNFQIHHSDLNVKNNTFKNLFALHRIDHKKLHIREDKRAKELLLSQNGDEPWTLPLTIPVSVL